MHYRARWLTELSARKTEEKNALPQPQGDEDGPASDGGDEEVNDFTDDDEDDASMSGSSEPPPEPAERPTEKYAGYFERQREVSSLYCNIFSIRCSCVSGLTC